MSLLAQVTDEQRGGLVIATITGEIDASNAGPLGGRLRGAVTNQSHALAIDLSGTTYLDSAGIALLFSLGAQLRAHQQALHLVITPGSPIARMAQLSGLEHSVPTHGSREALLAQVEGG